MIWILYGTDEFRRSERRKVLIQELLGDAPPDFALSQWRGDTFSEVRFPELYELPFLAPHKVAVLLEAEKLNKNALKALSKYLENPSPHTRLIVEFAQDTAPSLLKGKDIFYEAFPPLKPRETIDWVLQTAQKWGLSLAPEAAALLVETQGTDLRILSQLIQVLQIYGLSQPEHSLSAQEVGEALGLHPQYNIYRFIDALAEKKTPDVLQILSSFSEDPKKYPLSQILWHIRQFFQNLSLLHLTQTPAALDAIQKKLKLRFPFQAKPYEQGLRRYSLQECQKILTFLREIESRQKGLIPSRQTESHLLLATALHLVGSTPPQLY
ncbi:MAG: DNA polymerase III subunit delta [Bacteroidia bacterium]|nr:DNA polymerase III subunit delta [Bacteroidia bacterium]